MTLACSGWAEEVDHLVAVDKVELGEGENAVAVERWLEREVKAGKRLDGGELGHPQRHLDTAVLTQGQFLGEQGVDDIQSTGFAALELAHGLVQDFQSSRHLQADQGFADAIEHGGDDLQGGIHGWSPWKARRWPTA